MRMEMVKEVGADTPSTYRWPWRNYMSVLLKTMTRQSSCLIQKRHHRWKITPWGEEKQQCKEEKLVGMVVTVRTVDAMATLHCRRNCHCCHHQTIIDGVVLALSILSVDLLLLQSASTLSHSRIFIIAACIVNIDARPNWYTHAFHANIFDTISWPVLMHTDRQTWFSDVSVTYSFWSGMHVIFNSTSNASWKWQKFIV